MYLDRSRTMTKKAVSVWAINMFLACFAFLFITASCGIFPGKLPPVSQQDALFQNNDMADPDKNTSTCSLEMHYPVSNAEYAAGFDSKNSFLHPAGHVGDDIRLAIGTPISAAATGTIVWYGSAQGYPELLVVIEHNLKFPIEFPNGSVGGEAKMTKTSHLLTIYGSLRKYANVGGATLPWRVGDRVMIGETIGFIDQPRGASMNPHIHFGIRLSSAADAKTNDPTDWYRAYNKTGEFLSEFASPTLVVKTLGLIQLTCEE